MIDIKKLEALKALTSGFTRDEKLWASGYVAGLAGQAETAAKEIPVRTENQVLKMTFAYGTETGNSKRAATLCIQEAKKKHIQARLVNLAQYKFEELADEKNLFIVVSTQGDGELPSSVQPFYSRLSESKAPELSQVSYSVLALGDSAYPEFCKAGELFDTRLSELKAKQLVPMVKCDVEYTEPASRWLSEILQRLDESMPIQPDIVDQQEAAVELPVRHQRKFYESLIKRSVKLTAGGSTKITQHIELESAARYLPGDALGVYPETPARVVESILDLSGLSGNEQVMYREQTHTLSSLLSTTLNVVYLSELSISKYARLTGHDIPAVRMGLTDLLKIYPVTSKDQLLEYAGLLEPHYPRLYSIASSPAAHPQKIHLTVARHSYTSDDQWNYGLCSDFLLSKVAGNSLRFYIHSNASFRLPAPDRDLIMIGPGTGIAPFRSFLWEREATGASGRNWLFFGDRDFTTDFLYQTELQNFHDTGVLTRINTAFSRDQPEKLYVQHRMIENGAELYRWIRDGACVYLCGAKYPMSVSVEEALVSIIEVHGGVGGRATLEQMEDEGSFLKDVY